MGPSTGGESNLGVGGEPTPGGASGGGLASGGASSGGTPSGGASSGGMTGASGASGGSAPYPASCTDGVVSPGETDIDCGGDACPPCSVGEGCVLDTDCDSELCDAGQCLPAHCADGIPNGDESDTDCGGSCAPCALGNGCNTAADCGEGTCSSGTCSEPNHCAYGWRDDTCGSACLSRTQSDERRCQDVLDCYVENDCGPATCGAMDAACGANTLKLNTAPYEYANQVYSCLCE